MIRLWLVLVAAGLATTAGLAAQAAWQAIAAHAPAAAPPLPAPAGYEAEEHFPGAALLYAAATPSPAASAAPAQGTTGTTALPAVPTAAAAFTETPAAVAAAPFSIRAASPVDRARGLECLTAAIYYEAASEPDAGQSAVAQVILNRVRHPAFPATVCGVVYQGSERAGCQFSFACDGAMARIPSRSGWARAAGAAARALAGYVYAPVGLATHYHTYAVTPAWNRSLVMTDVVGAHFFHRWKGFWGTSAAFHQAYRGGEPLPGPHRAILPPAPLPLPLPLPAASPALIATNAPVPVVAAREHDTLPPAATVLDRWKDSGKPLI